MKNLLRAEWRKATTVWSLPLLGVLQVLLLAAFTAVVTVNVTSGMPTNDEGQATLLYAFSLAGRNGYIFSYIAGILIVGSEYRHGTIRQTLLATPKIGSIVTAKVAFSAFWSIVVGIVGVLTCGAIVWIIAAANAPETLLLARSEAIGILARTPLALLLWSLVGVGVGFAIKNQFVALSIGLVYLLVIEPPLTVLAGENGTFSVVGKYLPGSASLSLIWPPPAIANPEAVQSLSWQGGLGVLIAFCGVLLFAGYYLRKRDIST